MPAALLAGLTLEHLLLADLLSDTAIRLIDASRPENLRKLTKEEADDLMKELKTNRDLLLDRLKSH